MPTAYADKPPTRRQLEVLRLIVEHIREHGYPPTVRWLMAELGITSPNAVMGIYLALARKGPLVRTKRGREHTRVWPVGLRMVPSFEGTIEGERLRAILGE